MFTTAIALVMLAWGWCLFTLKIGRERSVAVLWIGKTLLIPEYGGDLESGRKRRGLFPENLLLLYLVGPGL